MHRPRLALGLDTSLKLPYSASMKWLIIPIVLTLNGCAYTVISTTSLVTTGKSLGDHALTLVVPNADCNAANLVKDKYYCEVRDIGTTYNRTGF